ncbi:MAG: response regulator transcription factor [Anaerolineae bacterium]|nr:response regulator transcription factor [Anaerolineae bacterium]
MLAARQAIIQALTLAQGEGYIRVFVENGAAIAPLLAQVTDLFPDYVPQLLSLLPAGGGPAGLLLDPLTERELEILSLIARGCSNYQIADRLVISVGTVKGHVNHILSKLDAQNRTQAVARARELELLNG